MRIKKKHSWGFVLLIVALVGCAKEPSPPEVASPLDTPAAVSESPLSTPMASDIVLTPAALGTTQVRIMFRSDRDGEEGLYSMKPDGSDVQRMSFPGAARIKGIAWIPELKLFAAALSSDGHDDDDIYLLDAQGNVVRRLTATPQIEDLPTYSSAAGQFAFPCVRSDIDICTLSLDNDEIINLSDSPSREASPSWSPSGQQILFVSNRDGAPNVWVMNRDGSGLEHLTRTGQPHGSPSWSPDGGKILFTSQRDLNWEVYVMDADGQNPVNLTNHPARDTIPQWSPDGEYIAFRSDRTNDQDIYVMRADGTELINVTNLPESDEYIFTWSLDGEEILYTSNVDGDIDIYIVNRDGTEPINLTNNSSDDFAPQWIYH